MDGETGVLVSPGDTPALADALEQLLRDSELRLHHGRAGRRRIEQHFRIEQTVAPLLEFFEGAVLKHRNMDLQSVRPAGLQRAELQTAENISAGHTGHSPMFRSPVVAYLIDSWPDEDLPLLERELDEMKRRNVAIVPLVCEVNSTARWNSVAQRIASSLEFLPDAMVLEAEWRANPALAQKLEEERAQQSVRAPSAIFLRQARFALELRKMLRDKNVCHIHATSSRALVCALILKKLLGVTVSATIEPRSELSREWIETALSQCIGGRVSSRRLLEHVGNSFLFDKTTFRSALRKVLGSISQRTGIDLAAGANFWQLWADLLLRWSCSDRKSKIEN
jgi:hypothetical protein